MFMADIQYYNIFFNSKVEHKIWNKVDTKGELPVTQIFISLNFVQTRFREIKNRKHNIFYRNCKFVTKWPKLSVSAKVYYDLMISHNPEKVTIDMVSFIFCFHLLYENKMSGISYSVLMDYWELFRASKCMKYYLFVSFKFSFLAWFSILATLEIYFVHVCGCFIKKLFLQDLLYKWYPHCWIFNCSFPSLTLSKGGGRSFWPAFSDIVSHF